MSDAPANKNMPTDVASLEARISLMEESLARIISFDQTVKSALTHVLDRIKSFETLTAWAERTDYLVETSRSVDALTRASKIFPKTRSVVFVSKGYFGDNIKYAFLAFCKYAREKNVAVHFLADNDTQYNLLTSFGLPCLPVLPDKWTVEDARALLGAKAVVLDDNFHAYAKQSPKAYGMLQGAKSLQLWHGIPMKEIGMRYIMRSDKMLIEDLVASCGLYDVFVGTAKAGRGQWEQMFAFREFEALGYPRNDIFFREVETHDLLNVDLETYALFETSQKGRKPTILYTPTYRDDPNSGWFAKAGIEAAADHAREQGCVFVVNLHPFEQRSVEEFRKIYPGIHFVAPGTDIYPAVRHADILITDYSSLAFDFLLLDRPIIFHRPDHEYYLERSRGFIEGTLEMTPGTITDNAAGLIRAIDDAIAAVRGAQDIHRAGRQALRTKLFDHVDGKAGERVCEAIMKLVDA